MARRGDPIQPLIPLLWKPLSVITLARTLGEPMPHWASTPQARTPRG
jgi:hypothetical protein